MTIEGTVSKKGDLHKDFTAGILKPGKDKHFLSPAQLKYKKMLAKLMKKMNKKKGGKKSKRNIKMARKFRKSRTRKKRGGGCNCNECLKQCNDPPPEYEDEPTRVNFKPIGRHSLPPKSDDDEYDDEQEEEPLGMIEDVQPIGRDSWKNNPRLKSQEPELEDEPTAASFAPIGRNSLPPRGGRRRRKRGGQDTDSEFTTCMTTAEKTIAASIERGKEDAKKRGKLYKPSKVIPGLYKNRCCKAANKRRNCWKPDDFDKDMCVADGDTWKDGACIENGKGAQNISYEITGSELDNLVPGGRRRRKSRKKRRKSRRKSRRRIKKRTRRRRRKKR